jgi:hypothetical protein
MNRRFKAGDFTSGKMGEIYKTAYMCDYAIIDHRQFGRSYLLNQDVEQMRLWQLMKLVPGFDEYIKHLCHGEDHEDFELLHFDDQLHGISDFFEHEVTDFSEALTLVINALDPSLE